MLYVPPPCSRKTASLPTQQLEGQRGGWNSRTYADERGTNKFLHAIFNGSQSKGRFGWSCPSVLVFRTPLISDVPTHGFRYDECKMGIRSAWRVVLRQMAEEKLRHHPSERTIVLVKLAVVVSPDSQVECCMVQSKVRLHAKAGQRTGEFGRQEAISPCETDRIGENRPRDCVSGT